MESHTRGFTTIVTTDIVDSDGEPKTAYQCLYCSKRYGRMDHIQRHFRSHENARAFRCSQCPKSFNRKDLLDRHHAIHGGTSSGDRSKRTNRTVRACRQCILAKTKCSDDRPCARCRRRSEICTLAHTQPLPQALDPALMLAGSFAGPSENSATFFSENIDLPGSIESIPQSEAPTISDTIPRSQGDGVESYFSNESSPMVLSDANMQLNFEWNTTNWDVLDSLNDTTLPSNDFGLSIDADTLLALNQGWDSLIATEHGRRTPARSPDHLSGAMMPPGRTDTSYSRILSGKEIFQRQSPWLWDPDPRDSASSEAAPELSSDEERSILPRALGEKYPISPRLRRLNCGNNARDELLILVQEHSGPNVVVRSFPSAKMLTFLIRNFVIHEDLGCSPFIHVSAFVPDDCRPELLSAMISAGSSASGIPQIWKFGLALQERTRLAIYKSFDYDNTISRRLDIIQAQILWVESGLWSGSQRKMEVAESAAANVPTMLRRAGVMNQECYEHNLIPTTEDTGDALRSKWLKWAELESFKRAVLRAMIDDVQSSVTYTKSPCFYSTEITFSLPAARELWEASDPETWKSIYLARRWQNIDASTSKPTLLDIIQDVSILRSLGQEYDLELASFVALHCLWPQQGAYLDAKILSRASPLTTKSSRGVMWLEAQRQDLYQKLGDMKEVFRSVNVLMPEALVVVELFMMSLFIWPVDIQKLAGQFGVKESQSTTPNLRAWAASDEPRYAMWHAGQVFRSAQSMTPAQLRGFYAVAVYQASLTLSLPFLLSTFGSTSTTACSGLESDPELLSIRKEISSVAGQQNNIVILNGQESIQTKAYLISGQGNPALLFENEVKPLSNIDVVADIVAGIFRKNHSVTNNRLPLLLEKLVILMRELARVAGRPD